MTEKTTLEGNPSAAVNDLTVNPAAESAAFAPQTRQSQAHVIARVQQIFSMLRMTKEARMTKPEARHRVLVLGHSSFAHDALALASMQGCEQRGCDCPLPLWI